MAELHTVDSSDAAATLGQQLYEFSPPSRHEGARLHRAGQVTHVNREDDHTASATVAGPAARLVVLTRTGPGWTHMCSGCGAVRCAHAFAASVAWLAHLSHKAAGGAAAKGVDEGTAAALAASLNPPRGGTFRQYWEPILASKLGRPLSPEEGGFLGRLANVFHNFKAGGWLNGSEILRLGFATSEGRKRGYVPAYEGWWQHPPQDPLGLWQYIAYDIESSGLTVPEFMRPVTDTAAVRARMQDRVRRETISRWTERFGRLVAATHDHAVTQPAVEVAPEPLELRLCIGSSQWILETRARADLPWKPAPRGFLERFARDTPASLAQVEGSPAVFAFLALCQEQYRRTYRTSLSPAEPSARDLLRRLLAHRLARTLIVDPAGRPLTFAGDPVRWRLVKAHGESNDYELALYLPHGTPLPPSALHLPGRPDYYLHQGVVYRGPPALDGSTATAAIVPAEVVESTDVLTMLRQLGTQLPPEIEQRFVTVPMRPRIECALEFDFSGNEILTLNLRALSDQPPAERIWTARGWSGSAAGPREVAAGGAAQIVVFDYGAAERVASRLGVLKLGYDDYQHRWVRRVTKTFPEEFLTWRESLPREVEILATGELASLLGAPVRARVDFELIESSVHRDWFDLALALKPEDTTLTPEEIALLLKARGKLVRLPGKGWRRLTVQVEGAPAAALEAAGFEAETIGEAALAGERHRFHALQLAQSAVADLLPQRQVEELRSRARAMARPEPPAIPGNLRAELRPYQKEGFEFLAFLAENALGGVLADDMGLGKTVQTLAWLLWLAERQPAATPLRALVVCPKSVIGNWEAEAARFSPSLKTIRFTPKVAEAHLSKADGAWIVLANYTQLRLAAGYFSAQPWHAVILDEGQFIKTPGSKVAQVARDLPGRHRLILTGTPIENRLLDLWSLFAFALPGLLGSQASFKRHYAQDNPLALTRLRARVRHFLLRRTKAQVAADLPARTEEDIVVELEGEQAKLYQAELKRARAQLLKVESPRQLDRARFNILASLMRLRQICCHPGLIDSAHRDAPAAKLEELMERLEELRDEGHQVLVFSQFVQMLELIRDKLVAADIGHLMLTGQTENRDALVAQFQAEKRHTVFLLSLKAAGFGLNLTAASYVILYDPWWNPAVEAQAIDRTHRIGQSVPVNAYRLIARGTVEEKIRALQREKAALAGAIVQEESLASVLDLDSLRQILG